jgi:uncharacterized membrane protein YadS
MNNQQETQTGVVLGQRYAYATVSLVLGITCYVHFLGLEKAVLAIIFGILALNANPAPALQERRAWAKTGIVLAAIILIALPTVLLLNWGRLELVVHAVVDALKKLETAK